MQAGKWSVLARQGFREKYDMSEANVEIFPRNREAARPCTGVKKHGVTFACKYRDTTFFIF
jgi:hypothetical protein